MRSQPYPPEFDLDPECGVCGRPVSACDCPECPECGEAGDPKCYPAHGLGELPRLDLVAQVRARIAAGEYHMDTLEGDLALNLTTDKLMEKLKEEPNAD